MTLEETKDCLSIEKSLFQYGYGHVHLDYTDESGKRRHSKIGKLTRLSSGSIRFTPARHIFRPFVVSGYEDVKTVIARWLMDTTVQWPKR